MFLKRTLEMINWIQNNSLTGQESAGDVTDIRAKGGFGEPSSNVEEGSCIRFHIHDIMD